MKTRGKIRNVAADPVIFGVTLLTLIGICIPLAAYPAQGAEVVRALFRFLTVDLGIIYQWAGLACFLFLLWLSFSRFGPIVIGVKGEPPRFSLYSWVSMLFCGGVATGILYLGTIEWAYYYESPPFGIAPRSVEAIEWASTYGMFHWGVIGWAFYALPAVAIGYFYHNRGIQFMRLSTACAGVIPRKIGGLPGKIVDITFMVGLIGSIGTSIGLGTPMIAACLSRLFGFEEGFALNVYVVFAVTAIFATTVYIGLEKGIKVLADFNMALALFILAFILLAGGATVFILRMGTNSVGIMVQNFIRMSTWTDPILNTGFVGDWTVFYWAWWIAVGPFMGIFLAEISRGRTIRQIVLGSMLFGSAGCAIYYIILGNYALHLELFDKNISVTGIVAEQGAPAAIAAVIGSLPLGRLMLGLFCLVSVVFMATTYNSSSYALASCASGRMGTGQAPARWHRLFWAFALIALPVALMAMGDLKAGGFQSPAFNSLKTASLAVSLPLLIVFACMPFSLVRALRGKK